VSAGLDHGCTLTLSVTQTKNIDSRVLQYTACDAMYLLCDCLAAAFHKVSTIALSPFQSEQNHKKLSRHPFKVATQFQPVKLNSTTPKKGPQFM